MANLKLKDTNLAMKPVDEHATHCPPYVAQELLDGDFWM
jgi:hypothetical protein